MTEKMNVLDVIDAIDPELYKIANLLDLLTDLTFDLGSDGTGRSPTDRVHTLATACLSLTNNLMTQTEKLTEEARNTHKPAPEISDGDIRAAWRQAHPLGRVAVMKAIRLTVDSEDRAKAAMTRAETAEQQVCSLTRDLDQAHRLIERLRAQAHSMAAE